MKIQIIDDSTEYITRHARTDDEWDRDSTRREHDFVGFRVVGDKQYSDITTEFDIDSGKTYFLLAAVYSTGDSFGHDEGRGVEYLDLFETWEAAEATKKEIVSQLDNTEITYHNAAGKEIKIGYAPWDGYFASLDSLDIYPLQRRS